MKRHRFKTPQKETTSFHLATIAFQGLEMMNLLMAPSVNAVRMKPSTWEMMMENTTGVQYVRVKYKQLMLCQETGRRAHVWRGMHQKGSRDVKER